LQIAKTKKDERVESDIDSNSHIIKNRASGCAEKFNQCAADGPNENATAPRIERVGTGREIVRARLLKTEIVKRLRISGQGKGKFSKNGNVQKLST
jgi:hypothetical protein